MKRLREFCKKRSFLILKIGPIQSGDTSPQSKKSKLQNASLLALFGDWTLLEGAGSARRTYFAL